MTRVLAFCINAQEHLTFTKGISATEEPDLWAHTLNDRISLWIDVGEPAVERIKKATRIADVVKVYSFNTKSATWWKQEQTKFEELSASIFQFRWQELQSVTALIERTMELSITITGDSAYIATENGECEVTWVSLQEA